MPPQPKPKSNLLAFIKRFRKPQPPTQTEILMADKKSLYSIIDILMNAYVAEKTKNEALESANRSLVGRIADLENERSADAASDAAKEAEIHAVLNPVPGGSTGLM